jgi:hypothetical protein
MRSAPESLALSFCTTRPRRQEAKFVLGHLHAEYWLMAFASRNVVIHIRNVVGATNHFAPGAASVNWHGLAQYVPAGIIRVLKGNRRVSRKELKAGMEYLDSNGW